MIFHELGFSGAPYSGNNLYVRGTAKVAETPQQSGSFNQFHTTPSLSKLKKIYTFETGNSIVQDHSPVKQKERNIQSPLKWGISPDGDFGPATEKAIRSFRTYETPGVNASAALSPVRSSSLYRCTMPMAFDAFPSFKASAVCSR